jgi:FkbM family methyltransferase
MTVPLVEAHGFLWPRGAEAYGQRYVRHAADMNVAVSKCKQKRAAVQAGGHVGVWPKWLSSRFERVFTFEPQHDNFIALCRNAQEDNIVRAQGVLGNERGCVGLRVSEKNIGGHRVSAKGSHHVPTYRIDDLQLETCDLIVLDVEGYELEALKGARETLDLCGPILHFEDLGHIDKHGYGQAATLYGYLDECGYRKVATVSHDVVMAKC